MKAVVLGDKNLAINCIKILQRRQVDISGVVLNPNDQGEDGILKSLKKFVISRGLNYIQPNHISDSDGVNYIKSLDPDFLFSFSYMRIIKKNILRIPALGSFNIHFADLPNYRGMLPIVNALAGCEKHVGVTIHEIDEGIDTGRIILQEKLEVNENDTAFSLYFKLIDKGTKLFDKFIPLLLSKSYEYQVQELDQGSYFTSGYPNDRWIKNSSDKNQLSYFIRSLSFPGYPCARFHLHGNEHEIMFSENHYSVSTLGIENFSLDKMVEFLSNNILTNQ